MGRNCPAEALAYLTRIRNATQRMAKLIDDLLDLSRLSRTTLQSRFFNISNMVEQTFQSLRSLNPERMWS